MNSGVINEDSLTQVLRLLSQKRRHGVLEITTGSDRIDVMFQNGRIVGVHEPQTPISVVLCQRLVNAGCLEQSKLDFVVESEPSLMALYEGLVANGGLEEDVFQRAKSSYEMNLLYSLRRIENGFYTFNQKIVDIDSKLAMSISPGQLLLDMVELDTNDERMSGEVLDAGAQDAVVCRSGEANGGLSPEERIIWQNLESQRCLEELSHLTLLSEYELREGLLSLYDQQLIQIGNADSEIAEQPAEESLQDASEEPKLSSLVDAAMPHLATIAGLEDIQDQEEQFDQLGDFEELPVEPAEEPAAFVEDAEPLAEEFEPAPAVVEEEEEVVVEEEPQLVCELPPPTFTKRLRHMNFQLLQDDAVDYIVLALTLCYLVALSLVGPDMVQAWFQTLSKFASH